MGKERVIIDKMSLVQVFFKPKSLTAFLVAIGVLLIIGSFGAHFYSSWLEDKLWTAGIILTLIGGIPWAIFIGLSIYRNFKR